MWQEEYMTVTKGNDGRWYKPCISCGEQQSYLRKNYAELSFLAKKECKKCSNKKTDNCHRGFYQDIRTSWFHSKKLSAECRNLEFLITIEELWDIYLTQNKKCALSGVDIGWKNVGQIHTASIDRINSSIGYIKDNVQLVHKDVNFMKQNFEQNYFIEMCKLIADKVKW